MRCGTTSLYTWLGQHPQVTASRLKEPHHFGFSRPPDWQGPGDNTFGREIVTEPSAYRSLFDGAGPDHLLVDGSAMTLHLPDAAAALGTQVAHARAIVALRDPVKRTRSAHGYQRTKGFEPLADLDEALAAEPDRRARGWAPTWWYAQASRYADGVARLHDALGRDRVHLLLAEDLWTDPTGELARLCDFLGLPSHDAPLDHVNRGGESRAPWLMAAAYRLPAPVRARLSPRLRRLGRGLRDRLTDTSASPGDDLSGRLGAAFTSDVARLQGLLGRDDLFDRWPSVPRP